MKRLEPMTFEGLVEDSSFKDWVLSGRASNNEYWQSLSQSEDKSLIEKAATFVSHFQFKKESLPAADINLAWEQLEENIATPVVAISRRVWISRVAAAIVFLLISSSAFFLFTKKNAKTIVKNTDFGEQSSFSLSDASAIRLNANSELAFEETWKEGQKRTVNLKGQAFFEVQSLDSKTEFEVKTEYFTVEVIGTQFDVLARKDKASVILKEGKIKVYFPSSQTIIANGKKTVADELEMKPNQYLRLKGKQYILTNVNAERKTSWVNKKIYLENISFEELINILKDSYGYDVVYDKETINPDEFEGINGTLPLENIEVLKASIESLYNIQVKEVSEKTLKFVK